MFCACARGLRKTTQKPASNADSLAAFACENTLAGRVRTKERCLRLADAGEEWRSVIPLRKEYHAKDKPQVLRAICNIHKNNGIVATLDKKPDGSAALGSQLNPDGHMV